MKLSINEFTYNETKFYDELMRKTGFDIRVAIPAEITSIDFEKQTCKAQPTIRERLILNDKYEWVELPELLEVPFFIPFGGDFNMTFPIKEGDECLIVFSDLCIDGWWQNMEEYRIKQIQEDTICQTDLLLLVLNPKNTN